MSAVTCRVLGNVGLVADWAYQLPVVSASVRLSTGLLLSRVTLAGGGGASTKTSCWATGALAPAGEQYKDAAYGMQMTGGSGSIAHSFTQYREIGAKARAMLVGAAAAQWKVNPDQVRAAKGVLYGPGGQKATYGEFADAAMRQSVPATVKLKDPRDFSIIGKPVKRLDAAAKSTGKQQFGIDFKPPGAKVAMVARPPVFGAKVAKFDASKAKAIKGVVDVLEVKTDRGGSGVAVIAEGIIEKIAPEDFKKLGEVVTAFTGAQFSQKQEYAADEYGFEFSVKNGFSPYGMGNSLNKLVELSKGAKSSTVQKMFSSHPDSEKRAARMKEKADAYVAAHQQ